MLLIPPKLPKEHINWITRPLQRFFRIEAGSAIILLFFTIAALILSNSPWAGQFLSFWEIPLSIHIGNIGFTHTLCDLINDGAMTLFFFLISLELKRELVLGELRKPKMAALSLIAALGGMLVPALFYWIFMSGYPGQHGWGTVMATDTAFAIGCLALLGKRIPKSLRIFMLSLAVADDIGAILVIEIGYTHGINWVYLGFSIVGFILVGVMGRLGIRNLAIYFFVGISIWFIIDASGIHATITGVILGLMTPTKKWVSDALLHTIFDHVVSYAPGDHWSGDTKDRKALLTAQAAAREVLSPLERLEILLHPWVGYIILPIFALANAGIMITKTEFSSRITVAIFLGFVLGKSLGVFSFSWIAIRMRIATKPADLTWLLLAGGSLLAGIGFTMALFIADLSFTHNLLSNAKLGILLASIFCGPAGILLLLFVHIMNKNKKETLSDDD